MPRPYRGWFYDALNPNYTKRQLAIILLIMLGLPILIPLLGWVLAQAMSIPFGPLLVLFAILYFFIHL